METEDEKEWCYNCHWYREQGGSSHGMCPINVDIGYGCEDCEYWKKEDFPNGERPRVNQFMIWSGDENELSTWDGWNG